MKATALLLVILGSPSCEDRMSPPAPVNRTAQLTIVSTPVEGTTATKVQDITCPVQLHVERPDGQTVRGTFERTGCTGLLNATPDERGTFVGTVQADGVTNLVFTPPPLSSSAAINTSGGCISEEGAAGPYEGRLDGPALDLRSRFRLHCAGLPVPAPPQFEMDYRITPR